MFLLFGTRASHALLSVVTFVCGFCGQNVAQQVVKSVNRFTLFFVPLFPVSTRYFVECSNCGGTTSLTKAQADNSIAYAQGQRHV
ncbi:MAG: zinc-ribbon protein [Microbacteriaceae bacterium]|jgi:uncharacterized Zn finger protein|nr:zinc-ribbon protein [Microbacteriaceae bacterium]HEV7955620.1 zinc-ribbon domain-containing protein [Marisediminicola sp.]